MSKIGPIMQNPDLAIQFFGSDLKLFVAVQKQVRYYLCISS